MNRERLRELLFISGQLSFFSLVGLSYDAAHIHILCAFLN